MMKSGKRIRLVRWFFLAIMVLCLIPVGREWYLSAKHKVQRDAIKEKIEQAENVETADGQEADGTGLENGSDGTKTGNNADGAQPGNSADGAQSGNGDSGMEPDDSNDGGEFGNDTDAGDTDRNRGDADRNDEAAGMNGEDGQQTTAHPAMLRKYAALQRENEHLAGWLFIDGTGIDYPVMQCEDDEYYLHHDFYGEDSKYGCLYVRQRADLENGTNFVIYGHNMRDGAMFGNLDYYLKESFYREHPVISFDTLYEERVYEIVAVFRSQVYNAEDDVFKYYQFYEADTVEEFEEFYTNIKALSVYDTGVEAEFGDTFLTCSTCAYHVEDGRFVVVAKRVE